MTPNMWRNFVIVNLNQQINIINTNHLRWVMQDGKNVFFVLVFFLKSKAKPKDIDDFG